MSFAIDANILLTAADREQPEHPAARAFLERCLAGPELMYLTWDTVFAFVRIATNPRIFRAPLTQAEAEDAVAGLISIPHARMLAEQDGFWDVYREVTRGAPVRGNLVTDARFAALLRQNGVKTIYTRDADFHRFKFLEVRNPFSGD